MMAGRGHNGVAGAELRQFVERIERLTEEIDGLQDDRKAVFAEAKAAGFDTKTLRGVLRIRKAGQSAWDEAQAMLDLYLSALGMEEAPLFKAVGQMGVDRAMREQVIDAFKTLVPDGGEVIVKAGGAPVRLWRDKDGVAHAEDYVEPVPPAADGMPRKGRKKAEAPALPPEIAALDGDGAEAAGHAAARAGTPVIANPFPHDDPRRPRWDAGWRAGAGSDGMGPDEED